MEPAESVPTDGSPVATAGLEEAASGQIDVGILVATTPRSESDPLRRFAIRMARDGAGELADATDVAWRFYVEEPTHLPDASDRRPPSSSTRRPTGWSKGPTTWSPS